VANLGRQADCAYQEAYLLTANLPALRPRFVVHVFSPNDIEDLYRFLSDAAMSAFIAQPVDRITYPQASDPRQLVAERERKLRQRSLGRRLEQDLYVAKMVRWLRYRYREWPGSVSPAEAASPRAFDVPDASTNPASLGWRYTEHALAYMKYLSQRSGARLLMAPIARGRQADILRDVATRHGIDLIDTARLFEPASFLPHDGHLSPRGARVMAELIAAHVEGVPRASALPDTK
jgi:hypothetical protein